MWCLSVVEVDLAKVMHGKDASFAKQVNYLAIRSKPKGYAFNFSGVDMMNTLSAFFPGPISVINNGKEGGGSIK